MRIVQAEYIKQQIKNGLSMTEILDFYVGERDRNRRYKCPFNPTESNKNLSVKGEHLCRCFSCSETWDEIDFVQKLFGYSTYHEALERIAIDFHLDTKEEIDKDTVKKINEMKAIKERERKQREEYEKFIKNIWNKVCDRNNFLYEVIRKHQPYNPNKISNYIFTEHPDIVIKAQKQYARNELFLDAFSDSNMVSERCCFVYGYEDGKERLSKMVDMIKSGVIKINSKGDVLYG